MTSPIKSWQSFRNKISAISFLCTTLFVSSNNKQFSNFIFHQQREKRRAKVDETAAVQRHRRARIKITKKVFFLFTSARRRKPVLRRADDAESDKRWNSWKRREIYKYSKYLDDFIYDSWALTRGAFWQLLIVIKFNFTTLSRCWAGLDGILEFIAGIGTHTGPIWWAGEEKLKSLLKFFAGAMMCRRHSLTGSQRASIHLVGKGHITQCYGDFSLLLSNDNDTRLMASEHKA